MKSTHLALLAMAILASGCDKSQEELVLGTWDCQVDYQMGQGVSVKETQQATYNDDGTFSGVAQANLNMPDATISYDYKTNGTWTIAEKSYTETVTGAEVTRANPPNHPMIAMIKSGFSNPQTVNSKIITLTENEFTVEYNMPQLPPGMKHTCTR